MTNPTPSCSAPMRALVERYAETCHSDGMMRVGKDSISRTTNAKSQLLDAIATLEAKLAACCPTCRGVKSIDVSEFYPPDAPHRGPGDEEHPKNCHCYDCEPTFSKRYLNDVVPPSAPTDPAAGELDELIDRYAATVLGAESHHRIEAARTAIHTHVVALVQADREEIAKYAEAQTAPGYTPWATGANHNAAKISAWVRARSTPTHADHA